MLSVMRDESAPAERRDDMARAAAPYVHPRLVSLGALDGTWLLPSPIGRLVNSKQIDINKHATLSSTLVRLAQRKDVSPTLSDLQCEYLGSFAAVLEPRRDSG